MACFLADFTVGKKVKLACLRLLVTLRSPIEAGWQLQESVIVDTLAFITDPKQSWEHFVHSDEKLLWELRAIALNRLERLEERHQKIRRGADYGVRTKQQVDSRFCRNIRMIRPLKSHLEFRLVLYNQKYSLGHCPETLLRTQYRQWSCYVSVVHRHLDRT